MSMEAFDLAERFQSLVFVMSDLDLAMNTWMSRTFEYPEQPIDRGKVLDARDAGAGSARWGRYKDVDGDGIPYRTIPGTDMPAYFTRGSGHNENGQYSERPDDYVNNMDRLLRKFETARQHVPKPEVVDDERRRDRHHRLRHQPLGDRGEPRAAGAGVRRARPATCGCAPIRSRPSSTSSSTATHASTWSSRTATRQMLGLMRLELRARAGREGARACCTTAACRSTRAR